MVNTDLHDLRCLANNSQISYSSHAVDQMLSRHIIIVLVILFYPIPEIRVITVERVMDHKWEKHINENPWLVRKV